VRRVDLNTHQIVGPPIIVGLAPAALEVTPSGEFVYVASYVDGASGTGSVSVIRTSDNTVVDTIGGFFGPFALAMEPSGTYAYVTNFGSNNFSPIGNTVSVIDLAHHTIATSLLLGVQPAGVAVTPDGSFVYVSNYSTLYNGPDFTDLTSSQGVVSVLDARTNALTPTLIGVGLSPDWITISPDGTLAYVSNYSENTVSIIALPFFRIVAQGCQFKNQFLTQTDRVNQLTWSASGTELPTTYAIYRDADLTDLIGSVSATEPLLFLDHDRKKGVAYTYYIQGTNALGMTLSPAEVIVTQPCGR
jgi:YVTN family beta-propeller protein